MKILWIVQRPFADAAKKLGVSGGGWGGWIECAYQEILADESAELVVLTSFDTAQTIYIDCGKIRHYVIPGGDGYAEFRADKKENYDCMKRIISQEKPSVITIWGTESELGLCAARAAEETPKLVFMQGVMNSIYKYYFETTPYRVLLKNTTLKEIVHKKTVYHTKKDFKRRAQTERELISLCGNIIADSCWCNAVCNAITPVKMYDCLLPLDAVFFEKEWRYHGGHSVFCPAQYAPFKGFQMLLDALAIVKRTYPDVVLKVPGYFREKPSSWIENLKNTSYPRVINRIIDSEGVRDNIQFLGDLSRQQMADEMVKADVFVLSSTVENHSGTLREAMVVGMPCVAANVGSVAEYVQHGMNGYLYRNTEPEVLAFYICQLFKDKEKQILFSSNARETMRNIYGSRKRHSMMEIYHSVVGANGEGNEG